MQTENGTNKRKFLYILLALAVSILIWFFVDEFGYNGGSRPVDVAITNVPITYVGENTLADRGLMLMDEQTSTGVDLTLSGGRRLMAQLDRSDVRITANLNDIDRAGIQSVNYQVTFLDRRFTNDMIQQRSIGTASVNIKELNNKIVEIHCELVGNLAEGCSAGQVQLSQSTLELRGQPEDIDPVSYVKVTLDIGEEAAKTISESLIFQYYDENDQLLTGENIYPTVSTVQATLPIFVTKEVRLVMDFQEAPGLRRQNVNYEIKPSTIMVSGDAGELSDVETITLGQFNLLEFWKNEIHSHTYPIILPDGCQNLSGVTRATMEIKFRDISSAQVVANNFSYTNLPGGRSVEVLTQALSVTVFGTKNDVAAVTSETISVTADLSGYAAASGIYTVPAIVEIMTPGDIGISGTYQVQVSIREELGSEENPEQNQETPDTENRVNGTQE